jgi:DNA-binding CsgD family transcriptional regulator
MVYPVTASERDLRTLLEVATGNRSDLPPEGLPLSLLSDLLDLVRADGVAFFGFDSDQQMEWFGQQVPADDGELDQQVFWAHYGTCEHRNYPDRTGDLRSVTMLSDFYSARQWHATGMYTECARHGEVEHELMLCLPAGHGLVTRPGQSVRLVFFRGPGPDFSERDRGLLALLRPHLHQAYLDAERRRAATPPLTRRQWELLHLLAAGHTNTQIARRLGISEGTVRTHLENIYSKLQVSSRAAAVTCAFMDRVAG